MFKGENLHEFRNFTAAHESLRNFRHPTLMYAISLTFGESFLHEMLPSYRSAKVFSLESFPLYGIWRYYNILMMMMMICYIHYLHMAS